MRIIKGVFVFFRAVLISRSALVIENLELRQKLSVLRQSVKRPRLLIQDRVFWVWLARIWRGWRSCLVVVKPETVVKWHRWFDKLTTGGIQTVLALEVPEAQAWASEG